MAMVICQWYYANGDAPVAVVLRHGDCEDGVDAAAPMLLMMLMLMLMKTALNSIR